MTHTTDVDVTSMGRSHSSPLCSIRRNVRDARFKFAAEPPKRRTFTSPLGYVVKTHTHDGCTI